MDEKKTVLVDGIQSIGVHNGIARITFMRLGTDGRPAPVIDLCIPVNQAMAISQGISKIK